jgi:uncharacterized protein involved in exopolysaccharide biosynthesis
VATRRAVVVAAAGAVVVVAAGVSAWLFLRPQPTSDCAVVGDMIAYSKSENQRMRDLIPSAVDDPQKLVNAYQIRESRMHQYAQQIHDPGLREKAAAVVNLDDKMLQVWRHTVPGSNDGSTSQDFQRAYTDYARQSQQAGQALQAACPT